MKIKTRFAPSPTGYLHVGGARTALYSWLFARNHGGEFVLRIEDTDLERSTPEAIEAIMDGMNWLSLEWDEGPYYQTKRFDRYNAVIDQMLEEGTAYKCYCSKERLEALREEQMAKGEKPRYDGRCRHSHEHHADDEPCVVRFANPQEGSVVFDDQIRGPIEFSNQELDDLIIRRTDGSPTYNFCVVVDDWDMEITHVIRGEDHINNTPRQINILRARKAPVPVYAGPGLKSGIRLRLDNPAQLGAELLCGAVAALAEGSGPLVVISADTAISLMAVNGKQELVGGVILPGPQLSLAALVQNTAQLPQIDLSAPAPASVLGKNTAACLQNGFVLGTAGMLDGLADHFCAELGPETKFYATGNLPTAIRDACRTPILYRETLITDGLYCIWLRNRR